MCNYNEPVNNQKALKKILLICMILLNVNVFGQSRVTYLAGLLDSTRKERSDSLRADLNGQFYNELVSLIKEPGFVADSIKPLRIGQTASDDGYFIFYNWNIQQNDGQNFYYAFLYFPGTKRTIEFPFKPSETKLNEDSVYTNNDWPPSLYYKIISPKKKTDNYYLLFGWDRFSKQVSRKTIEALSIDKQGDVSFGKKVFKTKDGLKHRVVIEYASSANLTLQYSRQKLTLTGVRKSQSKINDDIIVVDRLAPLNEELKGLRWAYVPVGDVYDGYVYFHGYWTFVEGINARNPAMKNEQKRKTEKPQLDLFPH